MRVSLIRGAVAAACLGAGWLPAAASAQDCSTLQQPIQHSVNPARQTNLLTPWAAEADNAAAKHGFTDRRGTPFKASTRAASGLVAVHRLYKSGNADFVWMTKPSEIASAVAKYGYVDQGVNFYALDAARSCSTPVYRYLKAGKHRHAVNDGERAALVTDGWKLEGVSFHAAATDSTAPVAGKFSIAVMPDTQGEAQGAMDPERKIRDYKDLRFANRTQWLADNKARLNLQFVASGGDVSNWGERDPYQYNLISEGLKTLDKAGIPFSLAVGNHDTMAVGCPGGAACPGKTWEQVREFPGFNSYFGTRFVLNAGTFEPGSYSNHYSLFDAGGLKWMVLSLELWPREEAVAWARSVVEQHPRHNVIVVTHDYLTGSGGISTSNGGYGKNSPKYVFDNLVKLYPNIKMVLSGHEGAAASREDTGVKGNRIVSFLQNEPDQGATRGKSNVVRIVEIDPADNSLGSYIYSPATNGSFPQYDKIAVGLDFVQ